MDKKIGLFWLRDDFRVTKNDGLIEATKNHEQVVVFYLYKKDIYKHQEAQKWWLSKSLTNFKKKLSSLNISLEIIETNSFKIFFDKLLKKKDFKIYWNKVYEPDFLKFDEYLSNCLQSKNIFFKRHKGNALNEIEEIKKNDGTPFKVFTPFWRNAEKYYIDKIPSSEKIIKKCKKKINYFKNCIEPDKILPKKKLV
jgi:deoxyribodipyrimidine photo-lyase